MKLLDRIPKPLKNFYIWLGTFFIVWMLFVDSNDFVSQYRITRELNSLKSQKEYYQNKKVEVIQDREELTTNKELLEKFARENYLMKKSSEDIFVVVEND